MEKEDLIRGLLGKCMELSEEGIAALAVLVYSLVPRNEFEHTSPNGMPSSEGESIYLQPDGEEMKNE